LDHQLARQLSVFSGFVSEVVVEVHTPPIPITWCPCEQVQKDAASFIYFPQTKLILVRMMRVLPQCGQRAGGLTVCGTRWACASGVAMRGGMAALYHASARHL